ncbi:MAG: M20 metallopeptidase family protein [Candidatus Dormibacteria bacterium]
MTDATLPDDIPRSAVDRRREELVDIRRQLHRRPELSGEERATAAFAAERAAALGFKVGTEIGGTGVVADLENSEGPTLMLRADMDALPIVERGAGGPVRSEVDGAMHACGHDGHVSMALAAASVLAELREQWRGRLRLCFQPAEETASGAMPMIRDGVLDGVDSVLGIHLWSPLDVGRVVVNPGPIFGSADDVTIRVRGRGGHGGLPHTSIDPVVCAAQIVLALQTLVSRETAPVQPAVVTIGRIEGGTAFNVIAEETLLRGTVRAALPEERDRLISRVEEIARAIAHAHRAEIEFTRGPGCPPVVSDAGVAEVVRRAAVGAVGEEAVDIGQLITVGDDVAYFLEQVPGCYFLVGAGDPSRPERAPHHHPEFDIDERCLPIGAEVLTRAALDVLR